MTIATTFCLVVAAIAGFFQSEQTNPLFTNWSQHNVGTSVTLVTTVNNGSQTLNANKQTYRLISKDANKVVVEVTSTMVVAGNEIAGPIVEMTFKKFYDAKQLAARKNAEAKAKIRKGSDTLEIDGKSMNCQWVETEILTGETSTKSKSWTCNQVPGLTVKTFTEMGNGMVSVTQLETVTIK